jgi:MFS family permease
LTSLVSKVAPENERGSLLGFATAVGSLARFFGPIVAGVLWDLAGPEGAFYGGAVFSLCALVIAISMRRLPVTAGVSPSPPVG